MERLRERAPLRVLRTGPPVIDGMSVSYGFIKITIMIEVPFKDFEEVFEKLVSDKAPFMSIFSAEKDEKGDTWCPDCKSAAPFYP